MLKVSDMSTFDLVTTRQVAERRGITRQHVARLVREGKLTPVTTLANGAYLFTEDQATVAPAQTQEATE